MLIQAGLLAIYNGFLMRFLCLKFVEAAGRGGQSGHAFKNLVKNKPMNCAKF